MLTSLSASDRDALIACIGDEQTTWQAGDLISALDTPNYLLRKWLDSQGVLRGFYIARKVADFYELLYVCVAKEARTQGVGRLLIRDLIEHGQSAGSNCLELEVRESNGAARSLYENCGFVEVGRRENYYPAKTGASPTGVLNTQAGSEAAILYRLHIV